MKHILIIFSCLLLLAACKKETVPTFNDDAYLQKVKAAVKDSISTTDYASLDFSKSVLSKVDSVGLYVLRIPFSGKRFENDFIAVKTSRDGVIKSGKIIHQEGAASDVEMSGGKKKRFDGSISISSLDRMTVLQSPIVNGFITAYHQGSNFRTATQVVEGLMPEVVITYVIQSNNNFSFSFWMNLQSFFFDSGGSSWGNYYGPYEPGMGGGGGGPSGNPYSGWPGNTPSPGGGGPAVENPILIDAETMDETPELDLQKIINCFAAVPNSGAHCSIEILTDIPVDANPNAVYDLGEKAPGHTFLKFSKHNGSQNVEQYLGFYPKSGYKSVTYAPVVSKLVNNEFHEYNASLSMNVTPERLATALSAVQLYSGHNYDVDEYNCTNFAMDVFNSIRGIGLSIPLYGIPGSPLTQATATPGGLYNRLKQMWDNDDPEKNNIVMGAFKGWAGPNDGPCN